MAPIEKEARVLVDELLKRNGYFCGADEILLPGYEWPKLAGLIALVTDLLARPVFVPPADPDELAVYTLVAKEGVYWDEEITLDRVKECFPDRFRFCLEMYRAGKEAARG